MTLRLLSDLEQLGHWLAERPGTRFTMQVKDGELGVAFSRGYEFPKPNGTWARSGVPVSAPRALEGAIEIAAGMLELAEQELSGTR